ncbi:MAG: Eco57I restriction-modification methylase domain-containing protein [Planctomycetia bacterium]|nr:MAG: Eco57I restriction-modification methylase domain-containing protein [Planctomycetia bacterium]TVL98166.1 MAG: restriction endonuclease subunit R [Candidatus Brocadia sp. BL1]
MTVPQEILGLIERFDNNREAYRSGTYNETQLRREFIDPFFKILGWDVDNEKGYAEAYKDVIHEDSIKVGGMTKAPDYCFRIGGVRKFFVEAKKPAVNLKDDVDSAFQLRRYAWSAKLPLSILTDFEEFVVYDCRVKPDKLDKPSTARILYLNYTSYAQRWDEIASIFSRDAVLKGAFDKYAETSKAKRGTAEVDTAFLKEIESWRDILARNLALRNPDLSQHDLNFAIQRTIDRIIFLRICEDRGIEKYGRLMALQNGDRVYARLCEIFHRADERYNSGLFHFQKEKGRSESPDTLTLSLAIDDGVLKDIIKNLYYPDSPYEFSVLSADILGQVYEQFLGKVIRLTAGHRAVVEDKPEVKKAGGVYYTPTYIVDYIVKNTVGKLLECEIQSGERAKIPLRKGGEGVVTHLAGSGVLSDEERYRINPFDWAKEFPEIMKNGGFDVVIGNPPYVRQEGLGDLKEYLQRKYTVYHGMADLYAYFIEKGVSLLRDKGIFGYIVSNKWMRANYGEPLRKWLMQQCIEQIVDFGDLPVFQQATTYPCILVIGKGKPSSTFVAAQVKTLEFESLEGYVKENRHSVKLSILDDTGWSLADERSAALLNKLKKSGIPLKEYVKGKIYRGVLTGLNEAFVIDAETRNRLLSEDPKSKEIIKPFLLGRDVKRYSIEDEGRYLILIPKGWTGQKSSSFADAWKWFKQNYPSIATHLLPFKEKAEKRYDKGEYWWELRACEYYAEFEKPKIIIPTIVQSASYTIDNLGFYSNDKTSVIATDDLYLLGILNSRVADFVMHSISSTKQGGYFEYKPMYFSQVPIRTIDSSNPSDKSYHDSTVALVRQMLELHKQLASAKTDHDKTVIQRQIDATDRQIDQLVYELYGLTEDEIKIVEESSA